MNLVEQLKRAIQKSPYYMALDPDQRSWLLSSFNPDMMSDEMLVAHYKMFTSEPWPPPESVC